MIQAAEVASILGGKDILHKNVKSNFDLINLVEEGFPKSSTKRIIKILGSTEGMYHYIPEGTYKKRKKFSTTESEILERLARIIATAIYVFKNEEQAKVYLHSSSPLFLGKTPLDLLHTELGAKEVEEALWKIYYGLPV